MVIIYTVASVCGFLLSSVMGLLPIPYFGAPVTVGASAAIFGLLGALVYYGNRTGSGHARQMGLQYAFIAGIMGFVLQGVDNAAHLGGFAGGYLVSLILDPLKPERVDHIVIALGCLVATFVAILYTVIRAMPYLRA
jgi:rhomboid protease GluP